jgi:chemotaxis methyl-accepting protein methylase
VQEVLGEPGAGTTVTIFATDIDPQAIAFARAARFRRVDGLSPKQRAFYMDNDFQHRVIQTFHYALRPRVIRSSGRRKASAGDRGCSALPTRSIASSSAMTA